MPVSKLGDRCSFPARRTPRLFQPLKGTGAIRRGRPRLFGCVAMVTHDICQRGIQFVRLPSRAPTNNLHGHVRPFLHHCGKTRRLASFHVTIEFHEFQLGIFNIYSKIYAHTAKASAMTRSVFRVPAPNTNHLLWRRGIRLLRRQHRELELLLSIPLSFLLHAAPPSQLPPRVLSNVQPILEAPPPLLSRTLFRSRHSPLITIQPEQS